MVQLLHDDHAMLKVLNITSVEYVLDQVKIACKLSSIHTSITKVGTHDCEVRVKIHTYLTWGTV